MTPDTFSDAIRVLSGDTSPRVWSLIVTVFGDLAQDADQSVSGPVLSEILAPLGVKPEAMRVALHRLRAEGWLETKKRGREALHSLGPEGRSKSAAASAQIYARRADASDVWHTLCFPSASAASEHERAAWFGTRGYVPVAPGVYLGNGPAREAPANALVLTGAVTDIPSWVADELVPESLRSAFKDLTAALELASQDTGGFAGPTPMQIASLRALIVHRWRRLVLKTPPVPDVVFGPQWEGMLCRRAVMSALDALPRPEASVLK